MWTIEAVRAYYRSGLGSPRDLVKLLLTKIQNDSQFNAWIYVASLSELEPYFLRLDSSGVASLPLWGIPFALKDNLDVHGMPTTAGCPEYSYAPSQHAEVVQQLIEAGAIPLGKTNMDQFATGLVGTRSPHGEVSNPLFPEYISGGSSSGSAAALALNHCAFSLGTDTAGSGRVPAAFCNLVGYKPSANLISTMGVVPACKSLDCISIFAHSTQDVQIVSECAQSIYLPCKATQTSLVIPLKEQIQFFGDQSYSEPWRSWVSHLQESTATPIVEIDIQPLLKAAKLLYQGPWIAERWAALGDFVESHGDSCIPVTRQILEQGRSVTGAQVFQGMDAIEQFRAIASKIFANGVVLALPTAGAIFTRQQVSDDPILRNQELGTYTNFMNLLQLCGLAIPAGFSAKGLPFGVTLVGAHGNDALLFEWARRLQNPFALIAVCGAHMRGFALNHELLECGAEFVREDLTSPHYRFYALNTQPPKPGLVATHNNGVSIKLEIWRIPLSHYGVFVSKIPKPLGIGSIALESGQEVQGFICEAYAVQDAKDISELGGWAAFNGA